MSIKNYGSNITSNVNTGNYSLPTLGNQANSITDANKHTLFIGRHNEQYLGGDAGNYNPSSPQYMEVNRLTKQDPYRQAVGLFNQFYNGEKSTIDEIEMTPAMTSILEQDVRYYQSKSFDARQLLNGFTVVKSDRMHQDHLYYLPVHHKENIVKVRCWDEATKSVYYADERGSDKLGKIAEGNSYEESVSWMKQQNLTPRLGEIPTGDENRVDITRGNRRHTMTSFGMVMLFSVDSIKFDIDPNLAMIKQKSLIEAAIKISNDSIMRELIMKAGMHYFAGDGAAIDELDETNCLTYEDCLKMTNYLKRIQMESVTKLKRPPSFLMNDFNLETTNPVSYSKYRSTVHILCNDLFVPTLISMQKAGSDPGLKQRFLTPRELDIAEEPLYEGAMFEGVCEGLSFLSHPNLVVMEGMGAVLPADKESLLNSYFITQNVPLPNPNYDIDNMEFNQFKYLKYVEETDSDGQKVLKKEGTNSEEESEKANRFDVHCLVYVAPTAASLMVREGVPDGSSFIINSRLTPPSGDLGDMYMDRCFISIQWEQGVMVKEPEKVIVMYSTAKKV